MVALVVAGNCLAHRRAKRRAIRFGVPAAARLRWSTSCRGLEAGARERPCAIQSSILEQSRRVDIDERDVIEIVNTHLHFDHCGQNYLFPGVPVWVTEAELVSSRHEFYTVPEWAHIEESRIRLAADNECVANGVRLLHTPGHTPGHQSVVVDLGDGSEIIVGQACYRCAEFVLGEAEQADMHDASWVEIGRDSLARLKALKPNTAYFSHDPERYTWSDDC